MSIKPGDQFGMLTAIKAVGARGGSWLCRCSCGREVTVRRSKLLNKLRSTCGDCSGRKTTQRKTNSICGGCWRPCGGCSWSRDSKPVDGWTAVPATITSNTLHPDTFIVLECPQFVRE